MENKELKEESTLRNKVFEALGEASMCWSETPKGIFESSRAEEIGNRLMRDIKDELTKTILDTLESVGRQQFLQNLQVIENYEIVSGKKVFSKTLDISDYKDLIESCVTAEFLTREEADAILGYKNLRKEPTLEQTIKVLQKHLREDKSEGSYYYSWQANIAMSIYDEYCRHKENKDYQESRVLDIHEICNIGAKNFLDLLIKQD